VYLADLREIGAVAASRVEVVTVEVQALAS